MADCIIYEDLKQAQALVTFAETLGEQELIILFTKHEAHNKDVLGALKTSMRLKAGILVKDTREAMKRKGHYEALMGEATRDLLENNTITHVYGAEGLERKDKTHRRGSGLNQVSAKLIAEKKKTYIYDLSALLGARDQAQVLGRMAQNKRILSKYSCKQECYSMARDELGLRAAKEREHFLREL